MTAQLFPDGWRPSPDWRWGFRDPLRKKSGGAWHGRVVGFYGTDLTSRGYAIESAYERGSVQIYPESALEVWGVCSEGGE